MLRYHFVLANTITPLKSVYKLMPIMIPESIRKKGGKSIYKHKHIYTYVPPQDNGCRDIFIDATIS